MERFDKGEQYTAFWDRVFFKDEFTEEDAQFFRNRPLDNPRPPADTIEFTDIDLPF